MESTRLPMNYHSHKSLLTTRFQIEFRTAELIRRESGSAMPTFDDQRPMPIIRRAVAH